MTRYSIYNEARGEPWNVSGAPPYIQSVVDEVSRADPGGRLVDVAR